MRQIRRLTGAAVTTVLLVAMAGATSAQSPSPDGAGSPTLAGTDWILTPGDIAATLHIEGELAGGFAGCNRYVTTVTHTDTSLGFGEVGTTMMACPEPQMTFERRYLAGLATVTGYRIEGQTLILSDGAGTDVLVFEAGAPATLEGAWVATQYNTGTQATTTPPEDIVLTADFAPDGKVSGSSGCNTFNGGYSYTDTTIAIGPLMSTMMFCEGPAGSIEQQYLAALHNATVWSITNGVLELRDDDGALQVSFVRP